MKTIRTSIFVTLASLVFMASCGKKKTTPQNLVGDETIAVRLVDVAVANATDPIKASGLVSSMHEARLSFKTGGIIEKIYVKEGQAVKKGQLLAALNLTEINAQVQQAQENVGKIERDLKRVSNLYRDSVATLEQVQNLNTALSVAKQSLQIAQYNQGYSKIYAPENGVIVKKIMNEGELVGAGTPLFFFNATNLNDWVVKVGVADKDWARLTIGDEAQVALDAFPDTYFKANVSTLAQGADQASGLYQVELKLNTQGKKMATGLFAKTDIRPSKIQTLPSVPIDAIIEGNGDNAFVYTIQAGKAHKVNVTLAYINNQRAFIKTGLSGITQVVTDGSAYLIDGTQVKVVQ